MSASLTPLGATIASIRVEPPRTYAGNEDPFLFRRARTWLLLLALFFIAQANGLFTRQDNTYWSLKDLGEHYDSKPNLMWLTVLMWTICLVLMVKGIGPTFRMMLKQQAMLAFTFLAFLSAFWSQDPELTFRRAGLLFIVSAFAWFISSYYSPADQMRLLLASGVIVALACIAMALLLPQFGISSDGEWKGVFAQKNRMALGVLFLFSGLPFVAIHYGRKLLTVTLQALLPIGLILLSKSRTALILAIVLVAVRILGPFIASRRRDQLPFVLYSTVFGLPILVFVLLEGKEFVLGLLGKESTLTGRTEHWAVLMPYMGHHFWLGYGYQDFWTGSGDSLTVVKMIGGAMKGSDSGYIDMMLQFGFVGLFMLLIVLVISVRDFVRVYRQGSVPLVAYWYAGIILVTFVGSFAEILFLTSSGVTTFIFVLACAGLRSLRREGALHSAPRPGF